MNIPDEAVDAAAKAIFLTGYPEGCGATWSTSSPAAQGMMRDIRAALAIAAPFIAAQTLREASAAYPLETAYGGAEHAVLWLTERAGEIEAVADAAASSMDGETP